MASTAKRWLIGCGLGCGGLLVVLIALAVGFGMWVSGRGELLEPERLLGADTTGYVEWTLVLDDPGTEGFVRTLIEAVQQLPAEASEELPPWLYNWLARRQSREAEQDILRLFPMVAVWTLAPGREADDLHLLSVSIERIGNRLTFADWIMGWFLPRGDAVAIDRYRNEKIYRFDLGSEADVSVFIRNGNLFFTSDADTARAAIDRLSAPAAPPDEPTHVERLFAWTDGGDSLRGAIDNGHGALLRLWRSIAARSGPPADPELWRGFRGLSLSGRLREDGSMIARLSFECPDEAWADAHSLDLIMALHDGVQWTGLEPEIEVRPRGERLDVELRLPELTASVSRWIHQAQEIDTESGSIRVDF